MVRARAAAGAFVLVMLQIGMMVVDAGPAIAGWPYGSSCDPVPYATYSFDGTWGGSAQQLQQEAEWGFWSWANQIEHWNGWAYAITYSGRNVLLKWVDDLGSVAKACGSSFNQIEFDVENQPYFLQHQGEFQAVATHEWGHMWGLKHSGDGDAHIADTPTMATCLAVFGESGQTWLSKDDEAEVQFLTNWSSGTLGSKQWRTFTANPSFEELEQYWDTQSLNYFSTWTSGGGVDGSAAYGVVRPTSTSGRLYQMTRFTTDTTTSHFVDIARARVNVRKYLNSDSGPVVLQLRVRPISYASTYAGCQFPNNVDLNSAVSSPGWVWTDTLSCYPYSSSYWNYCTTNERSLQLYDQYDGYDFEISAYPRVVDTRFGDQPYTYVRLDRTRVQITHV
jgi:hypothetical protein